MNAHDNNSNLGPKYPTKSLIEREQHCVLCSQQLELQTEVMSENAKVIETAICHRCGIRTRVKEHLLQ